MSSAATSKLNLPYITAAQAQKHITHNEALRILDALIHLRVISLNVNTPPSNPAEMDSYGLGTAPTDQWAGKPQSIAIYQDGAWAFFTPQRGWLCFIEDEGLVKLWDGQNWTSLSADQTINTANLPVLGINTTADENNKLSVASANSLLTHDGSDHRLKINKNETADTASLLFQTNYSGRAEFGLTGSDDFNIKTSPDGSLFRDSINIQSQTGFVSFPQGQIHAQTGQDIASYIPSPVKEIWRLDLARPATPRNYTLETTSGNILTLSAPLAATIFSLGMRANAMVRLWNMSKTPFETCWVNDYNDASNLTVSDPSDIAGWSQGDILQLGDPAGETESGENILGMVAIDVSPYLENQLGGVFRQKAITLAIRAHAQSGIGRVGLSPTGARGSAVDGYSLSGGQASNSSFTLPCTVKSPVSDSNLIYLREPLEATASAHLVNFVRVLGVWA